MEELEDGTSLQDLEQQGRLGNAPEDLDGESNAFAALPFPEVIRYAPRLRLPDFALVFELPPFDELLTRFDDADEAYASDPDGRNRQTLKDICWELKKASEIDTVLMNLQACWEALRPTLADNYNAWLAFTAGLRSGDRSPRLAVEASNITTQDRDAFVAAWHQLPKDFRNSVAWPYSEDTGELSMWDAAQACDTRKEYLDQWRTQRFTGDHSLDEHAGYFLRINLAQRRHLDAFEAWFAQAAQIRPLLHEITKYVTFNPLADLGETGVLT